MTSEYSHPLISGPTRDRVALASRFFVGVGAFASAACGIAAFFSRGEGYDYMMNSPLVTDRWMMLFTGGSLGLAATAVGIVALLLSWEDQPKANRTVLLVVLALAVAVAGVWLAAWSFYNPPPAA